MIEGKEAIGYFLREQINRLRKQELVKQRGKEDLTTSIFLKKIGWNRNKRKIYDEQIKRYQLLRVCYVEVLNLCIKEGIAE